MITAVDSSVLLDVFGADPQFGVGSREALRACLAEGKVVACDVVWAEVAAAFPSPGAAGDALERLMIEFSPLDAAAAAVAGERWRSHRTEGGQRDRVVADFLIAAHARSRSDRLLTRDRGFYRRYFTDLEVLDPTTG